MIYTICGFGDGVVALRGNEFDEYMGGIMWIIGGYQWLDMMDDLIYA